MENVALLTLLLLQSPVPAGDRAPALGDLQAMYEELSELVIAAQSTTMTDAGVRADMIHTAIDTPDCAFVDSKGESQSWSEVRPAIAQLLQQPPFDSLTETIRRLSLSGRQAVVEIAIESTRTIVDTDGRHGTKGAMHTVTEKSRAQDTWILTDGGWKRVRHEAIGAPRP